MAEWFYTRPHGGNCERIHALDQLFTDSSSEHLSADDIVFVFQFPNPRDGRELSMSRLHQTMLSVFTLSIDFDRSYPAHGQPLSHTHTQSLVGRCTDWSASETLSRVIYDLSFSEIRV